MARPPHWCTARSAVLLVLVSRGAVAGDLAGAPAAPVVPIVVRFGDLPPAIGGLGAAPAREVMDGEIPGGDERLAELKAQPGPSTLSLQHVTLDPTAPGGALFPGSEAPIPSVGTGFVGITQLGYIPAEPTVAAGPLNVFSTGNAQVTVADRDGANRVETSGTAFFGVPAGQGAIADPLCFYDALRGRFVALAITKGSDGTGQWSSYYLAVSQTSDARGAWWLYAFDMRYDGATLTANWCDFPGLGVSDDKLAMSAQEFTFATNAYQWQKIRVVDRAAAYAGHALAPIDFANFAAPPGGDSGSLFATKPGRNVTPDATLHVFTVRATGGSTVAYRTITGSPSAPVLSAGALVPVATYTTPPNAKQLGTTLLLPTSDCRTFDFTVRNGVLTNAWHTGVNFGSGTVSAIRLFRMRTSDRAVLTDETFGADGVYYYYPSVVTDSAGAVYLGFGRSSATEYTSAYAAGRRASDASIEPSILVKAGTSGYFNTRWGDYTGMAVDPTASDGAASSAWFAGEWAQGTNLFGAWISRLSFPYAVVRGTVVADCDSVVATTADRTPLAGAGVTVKLAGTVVASCVSDAAGAWSAGWLEAGTYDIVVTPPAGGAALDATPGSGATAQSRVSASALSVTVSTSQTSAGNTFVVVAPHALPATTAIDPANCTAGQAGCTVAVSGSAFMPCSVVRFDGSTRATTYVSPTDVRVQLTSTDLSAAGTHLVTVATPGPGGGTSNAQTLTVSGTATAIGPPVQRSSLLTITAQPNPFARDVTFVIQNASDASAEIGVWNAAGQRVATLSALLASGRSRISWLGAGGAPTGIYVVRVRTKAGNGVCRFVKLR